MPRNPAWKKAQQAQADMKRDAVLQEAANVFNRKGYHATSLADVADRLHITKTALYYYVKNKNDLLYQCYLRSLEEIDEARDNANRVGTSGLDKICQYAASDAFTAHEPAALLNEIDAIEDPKKRAELTKRLSQAQNCITEWVREGIQDGSIADCDPDLAGRFVMGSFNWIPRWISGSKLTMVEITNYFVELTKKTLAPN
jgi:AcrR family transcriptional regulator